MKEGRGGGEGGQVGERRKERVTFVKGHVFRSEFRGDERGEGEENEKRILIKWGYESGEHTCRVDLRRHLVCCCIGARDVYT